MTTIGARQHKRGRNGSSTPVRELTDYSCVAGENESEGQTRGMIDEGRMPRRTHERHFRRPGITRRRGRKQVRQQGAPLRYSHRFNRSWGRGRQRLTRTMGSGAVTRCLGMLGIGLGRLCEIAGKINRRALDVSGIIAAGAGRGGRKEDKAQTCQRQAEGGTNQNSPQNLHSRPILRTTGIDIDDTLFSAACKQKCKNSGGIRRDAFAVCRAARPTLI